MKVSLAHVWLEPNCHEQKTLPWLTVHATSHARTKALTNYWSWIVKCLRQGEGTYEAVVMVRSTAADRPRRRHAAHVDDLHFHFCAAEMTHTTQFSKLSNDWG